MILDPFTIIVTLVLVFFVEFALLRMGYRKNAMIQDRLEMYKDYYKIKRRIELKPPDRKINRGE